MVPQWTASAIWPRAKRRVQVEKNVRDARRRILHGMPGFPDLATMNAWLEQRCLDMWQETPHGTLPDTIADV